MQAWLWAAVAFVTLSLSSVSAFAQEATWSDEIGHYENVWVADAGTTDSGTEAGDAGLQDPSETPGHYEDVYVVDRAACYVDADGSVAHGWRTIDGVWHYMDSSGLAQTGWLQHKGSRYYLDADGSMATGWRKVKGSWYLLGSDGRMLRGWQKVDGSWYRMGSSGAMLTGWTKSGANWYYLAESGRMATGWVSDGGSWYLLDHSGRMLRGWQKHGATWYYLSQGGRMATGWLKSGGSWYYLLPTGAMATGWQKVDGSWYYLLSNGKMAKSTWLGFYDYYLGSNGAWVPTIRVPYVDQMAEGAEMGCEGASLYMALRAKGKLSGVTYKQSMATMPYADDENPYHGFVGSPWEVTGGFDGMMMPAVAEWGNRYAKTVDMTGCTDRELIAQVQAGNPVVVWVSVDFCDTYVEHRWFGDTNYRGHVMTLVGYDERTNRYCVADPNERGVYWVDEDTFMASWHVLRGAVEVLG